MIGDSQTICAVATPPGRGGVGIVRISGKEIGTIADALLGGLPEPRKAVFRRFRDDKGEPIDEGIVIYFPAPASFTGEEVMELQAHGSPVIMDMLLERIVGLGARLARPGEFSERAFLNDRLDLAQAEAIADLIDAGSQTAARMASRSLQGVFSQEIDALVEKLIHLRVYVEAAIDFPEEEIDFLSDGKVETDLDGILAHIDKVQQSAKTGVLLRDGMQLVIAGRPNAGKSSLLNALCGRQSAIVTDIPGTTRDLLREQIQLDGMPIHLVDTAGLRDSECVVEQEGIRRAREEIDRADMILWVYDAASGIEQDSADLGSLPASIPVTCVCNKIDKVGIESGLEESGERVTVRLSAKSGEGIDQLRGLLKKSMGYAGEESGEFIARRRHLDALQRARNSSMNARRILIDSRGGELVAEELRQAQNALSEITGTFTSDELLGEIFSSFCIGK